jgi:hypothetical protein
LSERKALFVGARIASQVVFCFDEIVLTAIVDIPLCFEVNIDGSWMALALLMFFVW